MLTIVLLTAVLFNLVSFKSSPTANFIIILLIYLYRNSTIYRQEGGDVENHELHERIPGRTGKGVAPRQPR
jgi:hypothetical protein